MGSDILLLCDEDHHFLSSNSCSPSTPTDQKVSHACTQPLLSTDEEDEGCGHILLHNYLHKEQMRRPTTDYLEHLQSSANLASSRMRAFKWFIMVHGRGRLDLGFGTLFAAANYFDRFVSMYSSIKWEVWMIELLSIACLSIASKVDEVDIPLLDEFQTEDLDHTFELNTIKRMELAVLKALDWSVICITPYSYVGLLIRRLGSPETALTARTTELLVRSLLEMKFVECRASSIATASLKCALEELLPLECDAYLDILKHVMPVEHQAEIEKCQCIFEEQMPNPLCCPKSPVTVIPVQRIEVSDCSVNIEKCFFFHEELGQYFNPKKRKNQDSATTSSSKCDPIKFCI